MIQEAYLKNFCNLIIFNQHNIKIVTMQVHILVNDILRKQIQHHRSFQEMKQ